MNSLEALEEICNCAILELMDTPEFKDWKSKVKNDLKRIPELEAKAKAFDVLKDKLITYKTDWYYLTYKNPPIPVNCCKPLTQEEYEVLKKAGME